MSLNDKKRGVDYLQFDPFNPEGRRSLLLALRDWSLKRYKPAKRDLKRPSTGTAALVTRALQQKATTSSSKMLPRQRSARATKSKLREQLHGEDLAADKTHTAVSAHEDVENVAPTADMFYDALDTLEDE